MFCVDSNKALKRIQSLESSCPFIDPNIMISNQIGPELDVYSFGATIDYLMSSERDENSNVKMTPKNNRSSSKFKNTSSFSFKSGSRLRRFSSSSGLFLMRGNKGNKRSWLSDLNHLKLKCFRNPRDRPSISLIERRLFLILEAECSTSGNNISLKKKRRKFGHRETKLDEHNIDDDNDYIPTTPFGGGKHEQGGGDVELSSLK